MSRCRLCDGTGWRARTASGELLTADRLRAMYVELLVPRADGQPTYTMTRCGCERLVQPRVTVQRRTRRRGTA